MKELIKELQQIGAITIKKTEPKDLGYLYEVDLKEIDKEKN